MALHIKTDVETDQALEWLAKKEKSTKSAIVRELILGCFLAKKQGFRFGSLAKLAKRDDSPKAIVAKLKELDESSDDLG